MAGINLRMPLSRAAGRLRSGSYPRRSDRVVINATNIGRCLDGIGTYSLNVVRELASIETDLQFIIYVNRSGAEHLADISFPDHFSVRWVSHRVSPDHRFRGHLLRWLHSNYLSLKHRRSLIFVTSQLEAIFLRSNQMIMIHDIIPRLFRRQHRKQYYFFRYYLPLVLRRAACVITPSEHTRKLLGQMYGLDEARIRVVHNGVHPSASPRPEPNRKKADEFILYIGRIVHMKNVMGLLHAYARIADKIPHRLVIAGADRQLVGMPEVARLMDGIMGEGRVVFRGYVPSREIEQLLKGASVLVFPSFYEGFGLPPLEAMASGCPVVVSNVASLREVCGEAAFYVDPYDIESIADGLRTVLTNPELRRELIEKGLERSRLFSWRESAMQHVRLFQESSILCQPRSSPSLAERSPAMRRKRMARPVFRI
jgi:glycosyltransferase involved in cell wall biosynthesis